MTIKCEKNTITILNLSNNFDISTFDDLKPKFDIFGCTEFSIKKIVLELDIENYTHMKMFDLKQFSCEDFSMPTDITSYEETFQLDNYTKSDALNALKEVIFLIIEMDNSYNVFIDKLYREFSITDLKGSGYVYFTKPKEDYYDEDNPTLFMDLERDDKIEILEKWEDYKDLLCGGLTTEIPNKSKMTEIFSFEDIS